MYYVYMMRCEDNSLYTGMTTDPARRLAEHLGQGAEGAKYTKSRKVVRMEALWQMETRSQALKLEYALKRLPKAKKEQVIQNGENVAEIAEKLPLEGCQRVPAVVAAAEGKQEAAENASAVKTNEKL